MFGLVDCGKNNKVNSVWVMLWVRVRIRVWVVYTALSREVTRV